MLSLTLLFTNFSFFTIGLYILAPIYHTLTRSVSSDSIWAVTVCLLLLHLFLHDYSGSTIRPLKKPNLTSCISLNASVVASVFVASRLPSRLHALLTSSLPLCSSRHLLYQQILFWLAPCSLLCSHGFHALLCLRFAYSLLPSLSFSFASC